MEGCYTRDIALQVVNLRSNDTALTALPIMGGIASHSSATVLAGVHVGTQAMVGALAVATKDVRPYHVNVGIPAKSVRVKPNAPHHDVCLPSARKKEQ